MIIRREDKPNLEELFKEYLKFILETFPNCTVYDNNFVLNNFKQIITVEGISDHVNAYMRWQCKGHTCKYFELKIENLTEDEELILKLKYS